VSSSRRFNGSYCHHLQGQAVRKNKVIHTFGISGTTYPTTQRQIQENRKLHQHYSQKPKSRKDILVPCAICYRNVLQTFLQLLSNLWRRISVRAVERLSLLAHSHSSLCIFCRSSHVTKSVTVSQHPIHRKIIFFLVLNEAVSW
jgi:hypothetical protein